ncbi:MAG: hypothetical protein AAFX65_12380 [Cyanobacteria bacterium J06638_7]
MPESPPSVSGPARAVPIPRQPVASDPEQHLPLHLRQQLDQLLERAPSHLFPRARHLYFLKYPLEGDPRTLDSAPLAERFRTFVLRDTTCLPTADVEPQQAITRINELALVHWQAPQTNLEDYASYICRCWLLDPADLEICEEPWFREGGAWARLVITPRAAGSAPVPAAPGSTP